MQAMTGKRQKPGVHTPRLYVYNGQRRDTYYTITRDNQRINLGHEVVEAKRKLLDIEAGRPVAGTIAELIARYMLEVSPKKAPATHKDEQTSAPRLSAVFGKMRPADLRPMHVAKYLDLRGQEAPVRANREKSLLSHIYTKAMRWGIVDNNPCRGVERNTETPRDRLVTDTELAAFRTFANAAGNTGTMMAAVAWLAYLTAQRRGDLLKIRLDHITDEGIFVIQGKGKVRILIEWTPALREAVSVLRALPRDVRSLFLIANHRGQAYTDSGFKGMWGKLMVEWMAKDNENFHFHDLRAKAVTKMVEQGRKARDLSGHKTDAMIDSTYDRRAYKKARAVE